jgi:hypothetical protein
MWLPPPWFPHTGLAPYTHLRVHKLRRRFPFLLGRRGPGREFPDLLSRLAPLNLVGTRSTASHSFRAKSGTRWNASLPGSGAGGRWSQPPGWVPQMSHSWESHSGPSLRYEQWASSPQPSPPEEERESPPACVSEMCARSSPLSRPPSWGLMCYGGRVPLWRAGVHLRLSWTVFAS